MADRNPWPRAHCPLCGRVIATLYRDPVEHTVRDPTSPTERAKAFMRLRPHNAAPGRPCTQRYAHFLQAVS